jgi:hypothetical protein
MFVPSTGSLDLVCSMATYVVGRGKAGTVSIRNGPGTTHCTCGLVLNENGTADQEIAVVLSSAVQAKLDGIELEEIHLARGHLDLPSLKR